MHVNHWTALDGLVGDPYYFDPHDSRYKCCCQQCHATTGVKIIAGLICVTVLMEIWHLGWYILSGTGSNEGIVSSLFQLVVGLFLSLTIIYSLYREKSAYLLPYLLLQTVGLATGFIILFALIYVTLIDDMSTIRSFFESHGSHSQYDATHRAEIHRNMVINDLSNSTSMNRTTNTYHENTAYMGWMLVLSCVVVIALQFWLISIVFACWRYFRDKRAYGYTKGYNSYIVLRPPFLLDKNLPRQQAQTVILQRLLRSVSVDDLVNYCRPPPYRSRASFVSTSRPNGPKLSSISYDCSTKQTLFMA